MPYTLCSAQPSVLAAPTGYTVCAGTWAELEQRLGRVEARLWRSQLLIVSAEALLSEAQDRLTHRRDRLAAWDRSDW
jgi:hypothetical protein